MLSIPFQLKVDATAAVGAFSRMASAIDEGTGNSAFKAGVQDAANVYLGAMRQRYSSAIGSPGDPWADLAPSTKYARLRRAGVTFPRRKGSNRFATAAGIQLPILYDTGALYTSLVPGEAGYAEQWWPDGISMGSGVFYSRFHQDGGGRLPQRKIFVLPDSETLESIRQSEIQGVKTALFEAAAE